MSIKCNCSAQKMDDCEQVLCGKENAKDCYVIETYLEAADQLRRGGFTGKLVFGSSNKDDYVDKASGGLQAALATDFVRLGIEYGVNFGSMLHLLGI